MKRVLLVAINARYTHSCLALYCLKSFASGLNYEIVIREFTINQEIDTILGSIMQDKPHALAISVYIWNVEKVKKIMSALKESGKGLKIILGGPEVSYNQQFWFSSFPHIEYIIAGHGEKGFRYLLEQDLAVKEKFICIKNPPFKEMPFPYSEEDLMGLTKKYIYYESSRGCPFKCSYCLSSRSDQDLEMKNVNTVKRELESILAHKPQLVKFVDRTFNVQKERYRDIWNFLVKNYMSGPTKFHFEIHPRYLDDEDIMMLSSCPGDLFQFEIGIQSINPQTRSAIGRNGEWRKEKATVRKLINKTAIPLHLDLIAGLPFEDIRSIKQGINELFSLNPAHIHLGFLKVLPGTEMMRQAAGYGIIYSETAPYQLLENRFLSRADLRLLEKTAFLIDRIYNTGRFVLTHSTLSTYFGSFFDMYRAMASYYEAYGRSISRSPETVISFLLDFIKDFFPESKAFFLDTLRWDWCKSSLAHHYPEKLKPRGASELKKEGSRIFEKMARNNMVRSNGITFRLNDLNRSIFFKAESDDFKRTFMKNNRCAVFLPDRKNILLYNASGPDS